jgi:cyanophycin synthetase
VLVERCGVDMVLPSGTAVLNADDPSALEMAPKCKGQILLFATDHVAAPLVAHRAQGGRTVALRNGRIVFSAGDKRVHEANWEVAEPAFNRQNQRAALRVAWALGIAPAKAVERSRRAATGLRAQRLRWLEKNGRILAISTCRNPSAWEAVLAAVVEKQSARRAAICSQIAADWRTEDAQLQGQLLGAAFDRVEILASSSNGHGSKLRQKPAADILSPEHVAALRVALADGVAAANHATLVESTGLLQTRMQAAIEELGPGDLLFVQVGTIESMMALANGGEDLRMHGSSSTVTDAANLTRPLAET